VLDAIGRIDFPPLPFPSSGAQSRERDFRTQYALKYLYQDANMILKLAEGLCAPGPARGTVKAAVDRGSGETGAAALVPELENQARMALGPEPCV
jgi:hypothetical protein